MMFSINEIKQCIENCKIAGDVERDSKEFMLAAVMIIFSIDQLQNKNQLIIIKKKNNLRKHSGQIAFPGGKKESFDSNLKTTALRETHEEINLKSTDLEILLIGNPVLNLVSYIFVVLLIFNLLKVNYFNPIVSVFLKVYKPISKIFFLSPNQIINILTLK